MTNTEQPNQNAIDTAEKIIQELNRRSGFDYFWDDIDSDIKENITHKIATIIQNTYTPDK